MRFCASGAGKQSSAKCKAKLWFRLDRILGSSSKSSQQHIFTQQQSGLDGTPIPHLHKAQVVGGNVWQKLNVLIFSAL
jgi:hypothetical protein